MKKILGIDYGEVITGLSITDSSQEFAFGLKAIPTNKLMNFLDIFIDHERIKKIVIGLPKTFNNKEFLIEKSIKKFIYKFQRKHPKIIIDRLDERLTSKMAFHTMIKLGLKKKKRRKKEILNKISAILILQSYLSIKRREKN
ncbi:MAG: Holliday junction resolvase RuvX [Flavobacteriales bacterium]|jgi:putative Holliday junction resolvase|uniref:Holliday junction resolvase RuvX n=1 Tax=Blattabacterium sp. (Mastotermes darwiniensis) TaxID=39768 RepID=UPI000231DDC5|nr:Holliday junction resolvase RuvX [Blattabacterium sp. (Mastotermes darwiniensis)]AER40505.1 Holliday junction resolvase-like protein [Blattabacterium sp. (Mastotermes darwiniensis) str. MADAR]MDR1804980.1 Holliday junction resolvase RuvX [Flavobacteriales bacterium]